MIELLARKKSRGHAEGNDGAEAGFTLVELLVVLVILSLVMGLVAPRVLGYLADARVRTAKLQIEALSAALDLFYLDNGRYPSRQEGLDALIQRPATENWHGPYIQQSAVPLDPWGKPYQYKTPGQRKPYEILSFGSDGRQGGADNATDITGS